MMETKEEKNRRIKLGLLALAIAILSYIVAKATGDTSGDWWKLSLLTCVLLGLKGALITLTDVLGKKSQ